MKKFSWKRFVALAAAGAVVFALGLVRDRQRLREEFLRLHVVGASDSEEDQRVKLLVRDAVIESLASGLSAVENALEAEAYVARNLASVEKAANEALAAAGSGHRATVRLGLDAFPVREYDTFSLPSGVYQSLRVEIGPAAGRNWWCVIFPQLCYGGEMEKSVLWDTLSGTIEGKYKVRFWLLDQLGKLENSFFSTSDGS